PASKTTGSATSAPAAAATMAVVILYQGHEMWIGNDTLEAEDSPTRYVGALGDLEAGIDALKLDTLLPTGSLAAAITYGDNVRSTVEMGPAAALHGAALGTQKDYYRSTSRALTSGVIRGLDELAKATTTHKLLVVIGDGNDTNNDAAKVALKSLAERAKADHITIGSIIYKGQVSETSSMLDEVVPNPTVVTSSRGIGDALRSLIERAQRGA
ncbi:MAG: hypothetical protein NT062_14280, partial [Proteobacteria bacterium]|nr:hypothetical protein [Pseudomonadota bacterium]